MSKEIIVFKQHLYTSSKTRGGYQTWKYTTGLGEETVKRLDSRGLYRYPREMSAIPKNEEEEVPATDRLDSEKGKHYPILFSYFPLDNNNVALNRSVYIGRDLHSRIPRLGNYFTHSIVTEAENDFCFWDVYHNFPWKEKLEKTDDFDSGHNIDALDFTLSFDYGNWLEKVSEFLQKGGRKKHLAYIIDLIIDESFDNLASNRIAILDEAENLPLWMCIIGLCFPPHLSKNIFFTSYYHDPIRCEKEIKIIGFVEENGLIGKNISASESLEENGFEVIIANSYASQIKEKHEYTKVIVDILCDADTPQYIALFDEIKRQNIKAISPKLNNALDFFKILKKIQDINTKFTKEDLKKAIFDYKIQEGILLQKTRENRFDTMFDYIRDILHQSAYSFPIFEKNYNIFFKLEDSFSFDYRDKYIELQFDGNNHEFNRNSLFTFLFDKHKLNNNLIEKIQSDFLSNYSNYRDSQDNIFKVVRSLNVTIFVMLLEKEPMYQHKQKINEFKGLSEIDLIMFNLYDYLSSYRKPKFSSLEKDIEEILNYIHVSINWTINIIKDNEESIRFVSRKIKDNISSINIKHKVNQILRLDVALFILDNENDLRKVISENQGFVKSLLKENNEDTRIESLEFKEFSYRLKTIKKFEYKNAFYSVLEQLRSVEDAKKWFDVTFETMKKENGESARNQLAIQILEDLGEKQEPIVLHEKTTVEILCKYANEEKGVNGQLHNIRIVELIRKMCERFSIPPILDEDKHDKDINDIKLAGFDEACDLVKKSIKDFIEGKNTESLGKTTKEILIDKIQALSIKSGFSYIHWMQFLKTIEKIPRTDEEKDKFYIEILELIFKSIYLLDFILLDDRLHFHTSQLIIASILLHSKNDDLGYKFYHLIHENPLWKSNQKRNIIEKGKDFFLGKEFSEQQLYFIFATLGQQLSFTTTKKNDLLRRFLTKFGSENIWIKFNSDYKVLDNTIFR